MPLAWVGGRGDGGGAVRPRPPSAGLRRALGFLGFFRGLGLHHLVTAVITALYSRPASGAPPELPDLGPVLLLAFLPTLRLGLGPVAAAPRWGAGPGGDFGWMPDLRDLKASLAGTLALVAGYLLDAVALGLGGTDRVSDSPLTELAERADEDHTPWLVPAAVIVVEMAPLAEELLVRGSLWAAAGTTRHPSVGRARPDRGGRRLPAGEPARTITLRGRGIGLARLRTGRVRAGLVVHAANNLPPARLRFTAS
jgi:uncharacterized protein